MKEKILAVIEKLQANFPKEALSSIVQRGDKLGFAINLDIFQVSKNVAEDLVVKITNAIKLQDPQFDKVTIVLTAKDGNLEQNSSVKNPVNHQQKSNILPVKGVKKIIAVASAKGGVGKSTIAVNLAISLQKMGYKIALVDADIYGPSVPYLLDINENPEIKDNLIIPHKNFDLKTVSIGSLIDSNKAGIWRGPMTNKILHQLMRNVDWCDDGFEVDLMVIDMPPGTGDIYLSLAENFPIAGAVLISTPQALATIDVVKSIDVFEKLNIAILGIIQNMAYLEIDGVKKYLFGKDGARKLATARGINFLGEIPIEEEIANSGERRKPIAAEQKSTISLEFKEIAKNLIFRGVLKIFNPDPSLKNTV